MSIPVEKRNMEDTEVCTCCEELVDYGDIYTCDNCEEYACGDCLKCKDDVNGTVCKQCHDEQWELKNQEKAND